MSKQRGFTLIELIIAVVIVGILAAIALPSYQEYVRQALRAEVTAVLLENAHRLERHYTRHGSYLDAAPVLNDQSPSQGRAVFNIASSLSADSYLLTASAAPGSSMAQDSCASYTLNQLGLRTPANSRCWRR